MASLITYLKHRFSERSSWIAIGAGVTAASALAAPWSYVFLAISVIAVLVPDAGHPDA